MGYTRCTTFINALSDTHNLTGWKLRLAGIGLASRKDLLAKIEQTDPEDKTTLNRIMEEVLDSAGAKDKAYLGTQLHEATERLDRGEPVGNLGKYQADIDAYEKATVGITWTAIESFRINDELKVGGTADRIGKIGNELFVADIKTGGLWDIQKMCQQLAVYANSVPYDIKTGERTPDPLPMSTTHGLLIHLPAGEGKADLYWLNLEFGWEAAQTSAKVHEIRKFAKNKETKDQVMIPVSPEQIARMGGQ